MSMRRLVLVAMIGAPPRGGYDWTYYKLENQSIWSNFSFLAIAKVYQPQEVYIIGTEKSIWNKIPVDFKYEKVLIDYGFNEKEHWNIFAELNKLPLENSSVIFDLTHSFRSLPFISLLSIIYFKAIYPGVQFKKVLYGMYDARNEKNETPFVDLSNFIQIVDWLYAARLFTDYGLGSMLSQRIKDLKDPSLVTIADYIDKLTIALQMIYTNTVYSYISDIQRQLHKIEQIQSPMLQPFQLIKPRIKEFLGFIQKGDQEWTKQLNLAEWYYNNNQFAQAIITLRECIITYLGESVGASIVGYTERRVIEWLIKPELALDAKKSKIDTFSRASRNWDRSIVNEVEKKMEKVGINSLWNDVTNIRNLVGHAQSDVERGEVAADVKRIGELIKLAKDVFSNEETKKELLELKQLVQSKNLLIFPSNMRDLIERYRTS